MTASCIVDYAWSHPVMADLKRVGYTGIARYLSPDSTKNLTPAEVVQATTLGMSITVVWEWYAQRALGGAAAGAVDGAAAKAQAAALGIPATVAIYAAIDFGASTAQLTVIAAYLTAFGKASGHPVGVYGSALVCAYMLKNGVARYAWQTAAWSGQTVLGNAHLYQRISKTLPAVSGSYDENAILQPDFGQWAPHTAVVVTPTNAVITVQTPGGTVALTQADANLVAAAVWAYYQPEGMNPVTMIQRTYDWTQNPPAAPAVDPAALAAALAPLLPQSATVDPTALVVAMKQALSEMSFKAS